MVNKIKVIIFGNVPLATWVIQRIISCSSVELIGVVCEKFDKDYFSHHHQQETSAYYYCKKNKLSIITFEEAFKRAKVEKILGISVRYDKLFKAEFFKTFNPGIINLHGGDLPRYRGSNIANFAILEEASTGAGSLHFIESGVDEGDIVEKSIFKVDPNETAFSFFIKTIDSLKIAFDIFLEKLETNGISGINRTSQNSLVNKETYVDTYKRNQIKAFQEIDFNKMKAFDIEKTVRAFYFPPHEPAFTICNGKKIYLLPEEWK